MMRMFLCLNFMTVARTIISEDKQFFFFLLSRKIKESKKTRLEIAKITMTIAAL